LQTKPQTTTSTFFFFLSNYFPPPYLPPLEEAATDAFSWSWHVVSSCRCCMEVSRRRGLTTPGPALWPLSLSLIRRMAGAAYWHGAAVSRGWVRSAANACEEKQHQLVVASSSSAQHAPRKTSTRADARSLARFIPRTVWPACENWWKGEEPSPHRGSIIYSLRLLKE
jgi:hypothetical protein